MTTLAPSATITARIIRLAGPLGSVPAGSPILLAVSDAGLVALYAGISTHGDISLRAELLRRHPNARFDVSAPQLDRVEEWLRATLAGESASTPPLNPVGTPFQREVWDALLQIPAGETVTYSELARRMGRPDAVRAVASAVARNEIAIAIPCHRVIGNDGSLRGFRWGLDWKRALLEIEARSPG
jgi:O-6-methylguanine DNA methyltransferase